MFSTLWKTKIVILNAFILSSSNAFKLDQSEILSFGKELTSTFFFPIVFNIFPVIFSSLIEPLWLLSVDAFNLDLSQILYEKFLDWSKLKEFADNKINVT